MAGSLCLDFERPPGCPVDVPDRERREFASSSFRIKRKGKKGTGQGEREVACEESVVWVAERGRRVALAEALDMGGCRRRARNDREGERLRTARRVTAVPLRTAVKGKPSQTGPLSEGVWVSR